MASLLDHQRELLQECGISTDGMNSSEIVERSRAVLDAADRYRLQAEAPVLDEHVSDEFQLKDAEATMHTMMAEPYLTHLPSLTGGTGYEEVRRFHKYHFIPGWPLDVEVTPISRTVGQGQVVDELIVGFTHDREMDAILPGIKPTGKWVELPHAVVVGLKDGKVAYEHIYWDQGSALYQLGLLPEGLPVVGAEAAQRLRDPRSVTANRLMARWAESEGKD
jgi:carboxymethylenebutenolidase